MATKPFTDSTSGIPHENLPNFRAHLVRSIEHMIGLLDALDAHCDLEDHDPLEFDAEDACAAGDDGNHVHGRTDYRVGDADDAEEDNQDCCEAGDDRPNCSGNPFWPEHIGIGDDVDAEDNHDSEMTNDDVEGNDERWHKTAKDKQRIEHILSRELPGPGRVKVQRGGAYWYPQKGALKRRVLEIANDR